MSKESIKQKLMQGAKGDVNENILDFVCGNINSVTYMNFERLCYVTESTAQEMQAFFESLGFDSLYDFNTVLREIIYNEGDGPDDVQERSLRSVVDMVLRYEMSNMTEFSANLDMELVDRLARELLSVPEVYIVGLQSCTPLAIYAAHILSKVGIKTRRVDMEGNYLDDIANLDRSGLVLAFGFSRYHKGTVVLLNMLKKNGFHTVSVTDYPMSPLANVSDYSISLPRHSHDYTISYVAGTMLLNILAIYIGAQDKDGLLNRIRRYDDITQSLEYFF